MARAALWLYRILFTAVLPLAAPWLWVADRRRGKRRPEWGRRLGYHLPPLPRHGVWVQAVSVGEVGVARPLLAELRRRHPEQPLVLSATTSTGLSLASGVQLADVALAFPVDLPGPVRRVLDAASPRLFVLVETELWPELLAGCASRGIPVAIVNARVSDRSFRGYLAIRGVLRHLLAPVTVALAQSELDASRLVAMGIPAEKVRVAGNIKFDIEPPSAPSRAVAQLRQMAGGRRILVAGSTMPGEDAAVLEAVGRIPAGIRPFVVLAPRHVERAGEVLTLAGTVGLSAIRRSLLADGRDGLDVVVLDTLGELATLYQLADVAFVGGSLVPTGGHNPIEPARFGVPVLTGPHTRNFAAVYAEFLAVGAALVVNSQGELMKELTRWLVNPQAARRAGEAGRELLVRNAGATRRVADVLETFLS